MKKLLLSSIVLFLFSASMLLFQMSCHKEAMAKSLSSQGKIVYTKFDNSGNTRIWTANNDGSNAQVLPISLPNGVSLWSNTGSSPIAISSDATKLFFTGNNGTTSQMYSCNIDGSGVVAIINDSAMYTYYGIAAY